MEDRAQTFDSRTDRWAIVLSSVCFVHCFLTPLFFVGIPFADQLAVESWTHALFLAILLPFGGYAIWKGYRLHHNPRVLFMAVGGFALLIIGLLYGHASKQPLSWEGVILTSLGSATLILTHLLNLKYCRCACCDETGDVTSS